MNWFFLVSVCQCGTTFLAWKFYLSNFYLVIFWQRLIDLNGHWPKYWHAPCILRAATEPCGFIFLIFTFFKLTFSHRHRGFKMQESCLLITFVARQDTTKTNVGSNLAWYSNQLPSYIDQKPLVVIRQHVTASSYWALWVYFYLYYFLITAYREGNDRIVLRGNAGLSLEIGTPKWLLF